ncbi:hypothetical protein OKW21_003115 [Catalinimonas alkaloidigena]|uniref:hypothetical protein n=1 Tax=Catalinimonas alkaloidigena TaxID=1075417 RepID=UPI002405D89A|nr:hypothetical protein [Catalinimonas alkaloidigena]MDF9797852.1 hypothetical protein [Catalinimonas alkaloidigena]
MDLKNIKTFSIRDKVRLLKERGTYLVTRISQNYYIKLYSYKGMYFEVWSSSHLPWYDIAKVKLLEDFRQLGPYLPSDFFARK